MHQKDTPLPAPTFDPPAALAATHTPSVGLPVVHSHDDHLGRALYALAHPARRFAMELLLWGPGAATSIGSSVADVYGISVGSASRHLAILANAGLVDVTVDSNYRWHSLAVPIAPEVPAWLGAMAGELWDPRDRV